MTSPDRAASARLLALLLLLSRSPCVHQSIVLTYGISVRLIKDRHLKCSLDRINSEAGSPVISMIQLSVFVLLSLDDSPDCLCVYASLINMA